MNQKNCVRSGLFVLVLAASLGAAWAKPKTTLLDGLQADLVARVVAIGEPQDEIQAARALALAGSIKNIAKDKSASLADDLGTLKKVAAKVELVYGDNDAGLVTAMDGFVARVTADLATAESGAAALFDPNTRTFVDALLVKARAALAATNAPPAGGNSVKLRAVTLRAAAKAVAAAQVRIDRPEKCVNGGGFRALVGGAEFEPKYTSGAFVATAYTAQPQVVDVAFYHFDRKLENVNARGSAFVTFDGPLFRGAGTYTVGTDVAVEYQKDGKYLFATSGTVLVSRWDPVRKDLRGTVTCTLTDFSQETRPTTELTDGAFRACRWRLHAPE